MLKYLKLTQKLNYKYFIRLFKVDKKIKNDLKYNLKNILIEGNFTVIEKKDSYTLLKTLSGNLIRIKCSMVNDKFEMLAFDEGLLSELIKRDKQAKNNQSKAYFRKAGIFHVISHTMDALEFLNTVSNHLRNFDNILKMTPVLSNLATINNLPNFTSYFHSAKPHYENEEELIFFHMLYKELFGKFYYIWDDSKNCLVDNYISQIMHIGPDNFTYHEIINSQSFFEKYIESKAEIYNIYLKIKF